ncbi:MAG: rhodanese-like domain-containing protein [Candidatus Competibacteraceae bacterium]|nr:rhodanese-like domain-containing protein [Candidatus Competibacteraceae bacterium]
MQGEFIGDVSPLQAWESLQRQGETVLVDVRTYAEWAYVGGPDLSSLNKPVVRIEWLMFPTMAQNPGFIKELQAEGIDPPQVVYLLCRSGVRSRQAAEWLAAHGYTTYNVADGFEGQLDGDGHRGMGGWRAVGLPWKQS